MNIKKVIVLLFAAVMGHMVAASDVDLYRGLLFWIKDQNNIEGNELRKTTYPLSLEFDGSFNNQLAGAAIPQRDSQDYTLSLSFKVGELNCINRLFVIGSHSIYLGADNMLYYDGLSTTFFVEAVDKYYSLVFRVDESHWLTIYAGVKDQRLSPVMTSLISGCLNFSSAVEMDSFKLGYGSKPSTGNLQSGQFANIRFWTRSLSDEECAMVDKSQNVMLETKPLGCPTGVKYDFFPLGGNMFGVDESSATPKCSTNIAASGWCAKSGRLDSTGYAMSSSGNGNICIDRFNDFFDGGYVLNNGKEFSDVNYLKRRSYAVPCGHLFHGCCTGYIYYPHPCYATSTSISDATYSMWFRIKVKPANTIKLLERKSVPEKVSNDYETMINSNATLSVSLTSTMKLCLEGSGLTKTTFSTLLNVNEWYHIALVGRSKLALSLYLNGVEIGNVGTSCTSLGYIPPIDGRYKQIGGRSSTGSDDGMKGAIYDVTAKLEIGGWDGEVDEIAFYGKALNAGEIKKIYEEGAPPDPNTAITPTTRNFSTGGGGGAIITSGSAATWWARATEPWIALNANSGNIGYPVAYTVSATTNAEQRIGYVYVNGHAHEVTQDGLGGTIDSDGATYEKAGGSGTIAVGVQNGVAWKAMSNVNWLSVSPKNGVGPGSVAYQVAPLDEVATRQGTLTIAGNTFTVFQYGRRMKLEPVTATQNYEAHVIPITVNALDTTQWSVTPINSWISIVDGGNGHGGDLVTIAIAENPSYKARTGMVTIGTETFTVTQQGRPTADLSFSVSPSQTTASVNGANGIVSVMATPDLPWTATSGANWITIYAATANGAGNGNVVYSASPNPTLFERTGTITVTPEAVSGIAAKTQTVVQPAAESSLSLGGYEFEAAGGSCSVEVSVANIVQWSADESIDWITVNGSTSRTGPGTVVLQAAANGTVYPRSGTVTIAGKAFAVSQRARGVEVEYESMLFGTDGGYESISIHPDGNSDWMAVASDPTWITIFQGDSGTGDGEIMYIVAPYNGDGSARTGWIEVGDKKVYITQRPYELSVSPNGSVVKGNNGAGEFGVSANIGAVWNAIATEPWITLVSGYDAGTGSGTVRFICEDNNTGRPRVGKIIVAGEEYTVTQSARILVQIQATAGRGGSITGAGTYDKGEKIVLTAVPDSGYQFVRWTGPVSSTGNPLVMDADDLTGIRAEFEPMPIDFTSVKSSLDGVDLAWNTLAWATTYRLFRGETDDIAAATELATFLNGEVGAYHDETGERGVSYWYWVAAIGDEDNVVSMPVSGMRKPIVNSPITYENLRGTTHANPDTYVEGRPVSFLSPSAITGYTFTGWTPPRITEEMTGAQTVWAQWTANRYSIVYNANGGSGTTKATAATYDQEAEVAANEFSRVGHSFVGWATNATGAVVFVPGQPVTNLTEVADGVLTFFAAWRVNQYTVTFDANGGTGGKTVTQNFGTALVAPAVTRTGYTFTGWSSSVPATVPAANATYVAQWTKNKYMVTFDANGGSGGWSRSMDYGSAIAAPTVTRTGYSFTGWSSSVPATVPAANATYVAQWTKNKYMVTFDANGGSGGWSRSMDYGSAIAAPTVTRTGYSFTGWSPAVAATVPAGNVTYTAQWKVNQYTVTFDANGGTGGKTVTQNYGTALSTPTVTRTGYTFTGWSSSVPATVPAANATYVAQWKVNQYTVTFDANGGTGGKTVTQNYGTALVAPTVTRTGYTFAGWSPTVPATVPAANATYVAQWTKNKYMVTFDANGGSGGWSRSMDYGSAIATPTVTRTGYSFTGWSPTVPATVPAANATYVAQWTKNKYTVTFDANGGTGLHSNSLYMVIDLSGGSSATHYPVSYLDDVPVGGWSDEYKTTRLVMRRIPAGSFMMGDGKNSNLQEDGNEVEPVHLVTLTKDFYMGVFQVTQRQWELVMGSNPSYFSGYSDSSRRPVETVSYNMIRGETDGAGWPQNSNVDEGSFLAVIRAKAGLDNLDLPTSAQWEYACRAGTVTDLNTGVDITGASTDSKLNGVGWYSGNSMGGTHEVGLCAVNSWGLYDMHGNVWEWCLDWYDYPTGETATDPVGPLTKRNWGDAARVIRGGAHDSGAGQCRSACARCYTCYRVDHLWGDFGFRLAMTVEPIGGIGATSMELEYGVTLGTLPEPAWTGYTFDGWWTKNSGGTKISTTTQVTGNATYYAHWTVNKYTITFDANGGSGGKTVKQNYGTALAAPTVTRTGYTFVGWSPALPATVPARNVTYTAQWQVLPTYAITYKPGSNGTGPQQTAIKTQHAALALKGAIFSRIGYTQTGWATSDGGTMRYGLNASYAEDVAITLYPVWEVNTYTLKLHRNNSSSDTASAGRSMTYGKARSLPKIETELKWAPRSGYTFLGWGMSANSTSAKYTDGQSVKNLTSVNGATLHLYAIWKQNPSQTYIVRLHRNNSELDGATAGRTYTIGKARALPKMEADLKWAPRRGYDFLGWAQTADATAAQYTDGQSLKDLTKTAGVTVHLYGVWKAHKYIVRLHRNNSKNDGATTGRAFDYDQVRFLPTMAELKWVRSGYMFLGWSQAQSSSTVKYADGLNVYNLSANDGEELHVWGVWKKAEANAYLLRLHRNNSERDGATAGRQLKLNTNRKLPTVKELGWSRTDATFRGWATTAKNAAAGKVTYKDGATVRNLVKTQGDTAHIYAVWQ